MEVTEPNVSVPESSLAREIFGPLGGIVALGAAGASTPVGAFAPAHRAELDGLLATIRDIGAFSAETMAIADELGWHRDHDATPFLVMWSGFIEPYPFDAGDPAVIRRMVGMGADLQLTHFLHALVAAALVRRPDPGRAAGLIADALRTACALLGGAEPGIAFRMWRVTFLPAILRPDSEVPGGARTLWRAYAHALEALLTAG
ncbi:hypothetical protein [Streptomyces sp. NBC_01803]|uniref:hypothetical protein n=1 Tax=Streptomyces sp. NBC_01803 TaxID=2975946 RepID=UPI002DD94FEC|nr:hypothetical protein [Streptomyces sp. NBC_01803]WSA45184.1 hypothetical protein OIE51_13790 [Streptomyces sp. NBC_01803]